MREIGSEVPVRDRERQESLRSFVDLCDRVGFHLEPFQRKIAGALLGPEREKLITLPRKNGKSRLIGTFAAWHLLETEGAQAYVAANSEEQARIVFEYARAVALHPPWTRSSRSATGSCVAPMVASCGRAADASKLLGLAPTLATLDEYCEAKDDSVYAALRTALLPGATMFTITTSGVGAESPLGRCVFEHSPPTTSACAAPHRRSLPRTSACSSGWSPSTSSSTTTRRRSGQTRSH
jgi:phage terminase large subunit-like protein